MMVSRHSTGMADFFKLSYMPAGAGKHAGQLPRHRKKLLWLWLENGCWAVAQELGQLPLWMHGTTWATAYI